MSRARQQSLSQQVKELQREVRDRKQAVCREKGYHETREDGLCLVCGGP